MSSPIITVEGLGKKYSLRHQSGERYTALRDVLTDKAKSLFRPRNGAKNLTSDRGPLSSAPASREDFWALKNVSFEVKQGEVVGIIGRNGAGKSTLLKILSRITDPTEGRVRIKGRVASLLEVGTGFHPELTGRENIYLNGAILGMHRPEIKAKFDEIVAFAETEKFLDTPVKRYSSGMYVRLAFAVAAHLEPEILVVDEVLAVGDAEFQKKCLGKMHDVASGGRTVLFVSHNMAVIQALCPKTILLNAGRVQFIGPSLEAAAAYLASGGQVSSIERLARNDGAPTITRMEVQSVQCHHATAMGLALEVTSGIRQLCSLEIKILDSLGIPIGFASVGLLDPINMIEMRDGVQRFECRLQLPRMARGSYRLLAQLAVPMVEVIDDIGEGLTFELHPMPLAGYERGMELSWGYGAFEIPLEVKRLSAMPTHEVATHAAQS